MKIMVFLHGTAIMHRTALGCSREERVQQVIAKGESIFDFSSYVPVDQVVKKLQNWKQQGADILYLSSHLTVDDIQKDEMVLKAHGFPDGSIYLRQHGEEYRDIAERILPDILIEDDCESIGGKEQTTSSNIRLETKSKIKSIIIKEFGGIDHLPDDIHALVNYDE